MKWYRVVLAVLGFTLALLLAGCGNESKADPAAEAPPPAQVERVGETGSVKVDHPEQFPVITATAYKDTQELNVTGVVSADISRAVPVISLAAGRVVEVHAKLGDSVVKGQLLMRVQSADISTAYSDYREAVADEALAHAQLERAKVLFDKGAMAQKDLEVAQDAEEKAKVTVETRSNISEFWAPIRTILLRSSTFARRSPA